MFAKCLGLAAAVMLASCATTTHSSPEAEPTWRASRSPARKPVASDQPLRVYVVSFGLSELVARTYPELADSQVGWGICNRIVEALWDSGRFVFYEDKQAVVEQLVDLMRSGGQVDPAAGRQEVPWLLYGEVVDLKVARKERAAAVVGETQRETRITIQVRLVDRATQTFYPATGTGSHLERVRDWRAGGTIQDLVPADVGAATNEAVRVATKNLMTVLSEEG